MPVWLLGALTLTGSLAMHIFVPALPSAAADLGATTAGMETTISVYILGMAVGHLIYGPLSDRYGRRPVLMAGPGHYIAAGLGQDPARSAALVTAGGGALAMVSFRLAALARG